MRKRNRGILFLMLPLVVFFWFFGWSLYWIGSKKEVVKPRQKSDYKELTFTVLVPEQKYAT
ncbi:hypothetical protein MUO79_01995 [Candidatus Bathyarchaeota archaeon]|nr:hypothetical protein [Candidatus Bathyarchaeota archaeon]